MKNREKHKYLTDDFREMKKKNEKITMITAYSYPQAMVAEEAGIDSILVGDSLGMVELGYSSTVPVTMEDMLIHLKAVVRGAPHTHIIADLPFMSYNISREQAITNAGILYQGGGADSVKLEGGQDSAQVISAVCRAGMPVCAHIGLTPQTASLLGGYKVQGKTLDAAKKLVDDALAVEEAGAFMIVLEAIPMNLAAIITEKLSIPAIGIGGGVNCDGQVLVFHDLMGLYKQFTPKFVKVYAELHDVMKNAIKNYADDVREGQFPAEEHSFTMNKDVLEKLLKIL
ncbi:MAG: 3-methyl-2-oxobutanoate hydroxymethyltransferase [Spirochaetia bacterium]|jgi:3-methyl-2-oxobutanoate hydroxymethyltransferase|nr:3-methyl-2-oxobutanoate hydroxymethyltransferase [Spirochaetia bacterium]